MSKITRRQFGTAAAAATIALQIKGARAEAGPNDRIRIGSIGQGSRGRGNLNEFLRNPEVDCVVVCDPDEAFLERAANDVAAQRDRRPDTVQDFRRVIERNDLDAVLVSTPDHWHALPTIHACQAGLDVYVEKPLARTIDEGRAILEAATRHNRVVQMGTQWRSGEHYEQAVEYVHSGKIGPIRMVRGWSYKDWPIGPEEDQPVPEGVNYDLWLGPAPDRPFNPNHFHRNFRWYWNYAGGLMTDLGVHVINLCQWATGLESPTRISSMGGMHAYEEGLMDSPDTQAAIYDFPNYTMIWEHQLRGTLAPHQADRRDGAWISGTKGAVYITSGGWEVVPDPVDGSLEAEQHGSGPDGRPAHVRNFLDCMASREQPVSNPMVGHHVTTIAHLGNLAYRAGADLLWDAEAERVTNNPEADALVGEPYREPWELPYGRRT